MSLRPPLGTGKVGKCFICRQFFDIPAEPDHLQTDFCPEDLSWYRKMQAEENSLHQQRIADAISKRREERSK